MKVIDTHTHFKEKFLKVLTDKEIKIYIDSGVKYMIGVIDFFPVDWQKVEKKLTNQYYKLFFKKYNLKIDKRVISNLLIESFDYKNEIINIEMFAKKMYRKLNRKVEDYKNELLEKYENILPSDLAGRFLLNINNEIKAAKYIEKKYPVSTFLCVGIHPLAIKYIGCMSNINAVLSQLEKLINTNEKVIGIGECGIENNTCVEKKVLDKTFKIAKKINVPVVIHSPLTYGKIPASRKLKGIEDICKIIKGNDLNIEKVTFDHLTDIECVKVINKYFRHRMPNLSISIQDHWLTPKQASELIVKLLPDYQDKIMVNSDLGTYQTPDGFSALARELKKAKVPKTMITKILYDNAYRFFKI